MFNVRGLLGHVIVLIALAPSTVYGQNDVLLSCSFEDDICNYVHKDDRGDFRWQRHEAGTPSLDTGPSAAYDGRFYLYIETSDNSPGEKAVLQTFSMNYDKVICVSFAYHMFGEDIGALIVRTSGPRGERLLDKRGNQGNVWIRRTVQTTIDRWASIFFEAEKGNDYRGDIAIDQFSARKGSCDFSTCDLTNGGCEHICHPTTGRRYCSCHSGFQLIGDTACKDVDECDVSNGGCQHSCVNLGGSYSCFCNHGFVLSFDGKSCADVDECSTHRDGCQHGCNNTQGSYSCYCGPGYSLALDKHNCTDTNECSVNNGGCQYSCHNIDGSFICCDLGYGLSLDGNSCADINECDTNQGGCQHGCLNSDGSYFCNCSMGYELTTDLHSCSDINECSVDNGGCPYSCHNIDASYICCDLGYGPSLDGNSCADINECDISNGGCRHNCTNTDGSFTCDCDPGHQLAPDGLTCNDIDECADESSGCAGGCLNTLSSYLCICDPGQVLGADKHSCQGCGAEYRQIIESSQAFTSSCPIADELPETDLDSCLKRACGGATVNMVTYRNRVCGLRSCLPGEYQLEAFAGSQGWDIYVRNTTEKNGGPGDREESVPVWQVIVGVVVGVVALAAVAVGVAVALRRRQQPPSPSTPGEPAHYENEPVTTLPGDRSDDRTTRDSTVYEDIKELGAEAMDKREDKASAKISEGVLYQNATFQDDCGYQDLVPTESHASEPYQAIQ